jgi:hypothetical protein
MVIQKSDERFYTFIINPEKLIILTGSPGQTKLNQTK